jgi:threonine synthase
MRTFRCVACYSRTESNGLSPTCERCGSAVVFDNELPAVTKDELEATPAGVWRYRSFLPAAGIDELVTLGEGGTPLIHAQRLGDELGLPKLMVKDESRNPTGSFMDRGTTVLLSLASDQGVRECTCVTTGNLGASLSAYCAKAGIAARIRINPNTDQGKLYQMLAYGAEVEGRGFSPTQHPGDRRTLGVSAGNPFLLEGEKTTGLELMHDLEWKAPDVIVVPVGTGGHLSMIWKGMTELRELGLLPGAGCRLVGVQVEGTFDRRRERPSGGAPLAELEESEPLFRGMASKAIKESGGLTLSTSSAETVKAIGLLARTEGIFAEPASASVVASLADAVNRGLVRSNEKVVCVITGAGLKDPRTMFHLAKEARRVPVWDPYARPAPQIGETKFALLRILHGGPNYGYELRRQLGLQKRISTASVYQHLLELETFGMVRRRGSVTSKGRERVIYELTRRGADYLKIAGQLRRAERARA